MCVVTLIGYNSCFQHHILFLPSLMDDPQLRTDWNPSEKQPCTHHIAVTEYHRIGLLGSLRFGEDGHGDHHPNLLAMDDQPEFAARMERSRMWGALGTHHVVGHVHLAQRTLRSADLYVQDSKVCRNARLHACADRQRRCRACTPPSCSARVLRRGIRSCYGRQSASRP